jgi:hypothetical protein
MTDDRKLKKAIRARQLNTGENYTTARHHVLAAYDRERATRVCQTTSVGWMPVATTSDRASISIADLDDAITHTPRDHELLVPASDPECGPYTQFIRVPLAEVDARCRTGYRKITASEDDVMMGESEDFTLDWKHSE